MVESQGEKVLPEEQGYGGPVLQEPFRDTLPLFAQSDSLT